MKCRVFNISQYEKNPLTGEDLNFNEENIKSCVEHRSIKQWAYICHDKDIYTEEDELNGHHKGDAIPIHWHVVLRTDVAIEIDTISRWIGVPSQYIDAPKGHGAFLDCVQYLTHEDEKQQKKGKHLYLDEEVKASFDFRQELTTRAEKKIRYGKDLNDKEQMMYDVIYLGKTLSECRKENPILYMKNCKTLEDMRHRYLVDIAEMPPFRINFYIDGLGGIGKNTASKILAKVLFPDIEKPYFEVGGSGVSFQKYDGEPVVIWNDRRASGFITDFGREETFDMFDMHPSDSVHNIKYGAIRLTNMFNIINGVDSYTDFLNGLSGQYIDKYGVFHKVEDKGQAYRRLPIILCLREEEFDCLINKGVAEGTREFEQYIYYEHIKGSFAKLAQKLEGAAQLAIGKKMLQPALEGVEQIRQNESQKNSDIKNIPVEFADYGANEGPLELPF